MKVLEQEYDLAYEPLGVYVYSWDGFLGHWHSATTRVGSLHAYLVYLGEIALLGIGEDGTQGGGEEGF